MNDFILNFQEVPFLYNALPIKIFMLDRNAVSLISNFMKKKIYTNIRDTRRLDELRSLDQSENIISVFASTIEGINPWGENKSDRQKLLREEIESVQKFYQFAQTDTNIIIRKINNYQQRLFESFKFGMYFLCETSKILYNPVSPKNYLEKSKEILNIADTCSISKYHPVVICALAQLYKNTKIQKLLKFSKNYNLKLAYNVMSDIEYIELVKSSSSLSKKNGRKFTFVIKSFDKSLIYLDKILSDINFNAEHQETKEHTVVFSIESIPKDFFTDISDAQYCVLMKMLGFNNYANFKII